MATLYKRGKVYWVHFGMNGQDFRLSCETEKLPDAKRKISELLSQAREGKIQGRGGSRRDRRTPSPACRSRSRLSNTGPIASRIWR
jgi:hypothetical protein